MDVTMLMCVLPLCAVVILVPFVLLIGALFFWMYGKLKGEPSIQIPHNSTIPDPSLRDRYTNHSLNVDQDNNTISSDDEFNVSTESERRMNEQHENEQREWQERWRDEDDSSDGPISSILGFLGVGNESDDEDEQ